MELRHIRYFLMVAEERSFTRAAARLGIAQPPLSAQIRQLEEEVGVPLFRRLPQGVELSAAGSAFLDIVQGMPSLTYRATEAALRAARGEAGAINLGFTPSLAFNGAVTSTIAAYHRAYPDIALGLEETNTARLLEGLREGSIDAAFLRPYESDGETLDLIPICKEPMIAALPDGHPAAADATVELKQLAGDSILLFPRQIGPRLYDIVVEACRAAGFEPRLGQTTPQIASMINLVAAGLGVSIVPESMGQLHAAGVEFKPIEGLAPVAPLAFARRQGETSATVRNLAAILESRLAGPVA